MSTKSQATKKKSQVDKPKEGQQGANLGQKEAEQQRDSQSELSHMGELSKSKEQKNQR